MSTTFSITLLAAGFVTAMGGIAQAGLPGGVADPATVLTTDAAAPLTIEARRGRGADDPAGHKRRGRGTDDAPNHG